MATVNVPPPEWVVAVLALMPPPSGMVAALSSRTRQPVPARLSNQGTPTTGRAHTPTGGMPDAPRPVRPAALALPPAQPGQ
jgi:hypothetical protein